MNENRNKMTMFEWFVRRLAGQLRNLPGFMKRIIIEYMRVYLFKCDEYGDIDYGLSITVHGATLWLLMMVTFYTDISEIFYAGVLGSLIGVLFGLYAWLQTLYKQEVM